MVAVSAPSRLGIDASNDTTVRKVRLIHEQDHSNALQCLNPVCSAPFRYLREGRIFNLEIPAPLPRPDLPAAESSSGCAGDALPP